MNKTKASAEQKRRVVKLPVRKKVQANAIVYNPAVHMAVNKNEAIAAHNRSVPHTAVHIPLSAHIRPAVQISATAHKTTFTRKNLPDGDFMINYYYRRDEKGDLVPEDIESATHFERIVYDRDGGVIGSTMGTLSDTVRW